MYVALDKDKWQALVYTVLNLLVRWNVWDFLSSWETISFSWVTYMELVMAWQVLLSFEAYLRKPQVIWESLIHYVIFSVSAIISTWIFCVTVPGLALGPRDRATSIQKDSGTTVTFDFMRM
jgi:hypothetical protein